MHEFFGVDDLKKVNNLFLLMVMHYPDPVTPEWLRGLTRYEQLPRVLPENTVLAYKVRLGLMRNRDIAFRIRWIVENLGGEWSLGADGIYFETRMDAVQHKLKWNDPLVEVPARQTAQGNV